MSLRSYRGGVVSEFEGEYVDTLFFGFPPLVPLKSTFHRNEGEPIEIPLHQRSLAFGYARAWVSWAAIASTASGAAIVSKTPAGALLILVGLVCAGLAAYLKFRLGQTSEAEAKQRAVLLEITGVSALPEWLDEERAKRVFRELERTWRKQWREWGGLAEWREAIQRNAAPENTPFLATLAAYDAALHTDDVPSQKLAQEAWAQLAEGTEPPHGASASDLESLDPEAARVELEESKRQRAKQPKAKAKAKPEAADEGSAESDSQREKNRIRMRCPRCEEISRIPLDFAGKKGLCPKCQGAIQVPTQHRRAA